MRIASILFTAAFMVIGGLALGVVLGQTAYYYSTSVDEREIVIVRPDGILSHFKYAESRINGDRKLVLSRFGAYEVVEFEGKCKCVTRHYIHDNSGTWSASRMDGFPDKAIVDSGKEISVITLVPFSQVADNLNAAQAKLERVRERYSDLIAVRQ